MYDIQNSRSVLYKGNSCQTFSFEQFSGELLWNIRFQVGKRFEKLMSKMVPVLLLVASKAGQDTMCHGFVCVNVQPAPETGSNKNTLRNLPKKHDSLEIGKRKANLCTSFS